MWGGDYCKSYLLTMCAHLLIYRLKFGAPFKISLVEGDWGPYRQIFPKSDIPKLKAPTGQNAETLNSPMSSFVGSSYS